MIGSQGNPGNAGVFERPKKVQHHRAALLEIKSNNNTYPIGAIATDLVSLFFWKFHLYHLASRRPYIPSYSTILSSMFLQTATARDELEFSLLDTLAEVTLESITTGHGPSHRTGNIGQESLFAPNFAHTKGERFVNVSELIGLRIPGLILPSPVIFSQKRENLDSQLTLPAREKIPPMQRNRKPSPLRTILPKYSPNTDPSELYIASSRSSSIGPQSTTALWLLNGPSPQTHAAPSQPKRKGSLCITPTHSNTTIATSPLSSSQPEEPTPFSCIQTFHSSLSTALTVPSRALPEILASTATPNTSLQRSNVFPPKSTAPSVGSNTKLQTASFPLIPTTKSNTIKKNTGFKRGRLDVVSYSAGELFDPNGASKAAPSHWSDTKVTRKNKFYLKDLFERLRVSLSLPCSHRYKKCDILSKAIDKIENLKEKKKKFIRSIKTFSKSLFKGKGSSKSKGPSENPAEHPASSAPQENLSTSKAPGSPKSPTTSGDCVDKKKGMDTSSTEDIRFSFEHFI